MTLIIAEKPSVANKIAAVVGATQKKQGYKIGNDYIVSWCIGHLIELAEPKDYDAALKKWELETLPIIPEEYKTVVSSKTAEQFNVLKELMQLPEVTDLIAATDAEREGELIFRLVYDKVGCKKPFKRLWISSVEESAIKEGLQKMKDSSVYDNLYNAAKCRQRADWLYGINFTRLYSIMYGKTLNCGRVQTPTVNLVVQRQAEIDNFVSQPYYNLFVNLGTFEAQARVDTKKQADDIVSKCIGKEAVVTTLKQEEKKEQPPALYDITSLQRDANRILGYTAQQTLTLMQSLYDHEYATYPRTDNRYISSDMVSSTQSVIDGLIENKLVSDNTLERYNINNVNLQRIVNDTNGISHPAFIPTSKLTKAVYDGLPTAEKNIITLVLYRLLEAVYSPYEYTATKVVLTCEGENFEASGREIKSVGFQFLAANMKAALTLDKKQKDKKETEEKKLPILKEGDSFTVQNIVIKKEKTKPPKAYTEDTLLSAMETAGKNVSDEKLKAAMKDRGLGTPATRAGIIENIVANGYIVREGKNLIPTDKAKTFIALVVDKLKQPELTGEWEKQLSDIENGKQTEAAFMKDITEFLSTFITNTISTYNPVGKAKIFKTERSTKKIMTKCPKCGGTVVEITSKPKMPEDKPRTFYVCDKPKEDCGFIIHATIAGKKLSKEQVQQLLENRKTDIIEGFTSKAGNAFNARLVLKDDYTIDFEFKNKK